MRKIYIFGALLVAIGAASAVWLGMGSKSAQPVACTMEAKLCPDGSAVGRTGPNCEFSKCPEVAVRKPTDGDIVLGIGEKGSVGDLDIMINALVGDSRCPIGVQCIWAGEFKVNVTLATASKSETRDISTISTPFLFDGHSVSINSVVPEPRSTAKVAMNEYRITLRVAVDSKRDLGDTGIITGSVTLSPTCPVERMPPEPQCAPKPYQTKIEIFSVDGSELVKSVKSGADGRFEVTLPFGDYNIQAGGGVVHPSCSPVAVSLQTVTTSVDISCDTGIR